MYYQPRTLSEALEVLSEGGCTILSGGTDFYPGLVGRPRPARILDISEISGLAAIEIDQLEIRIGAAVRWTAIAAANLPPCFQSLKEATREIGSVQIQNAGTVGGNLCNASPAADGVPPLLVLDAEVEIASRNRTRREPLSTFIRGNRKTSLQPDEIVTAIAIPRTIERYRSKFMKLGARRYLVISIVMAAVCIGSDEHGRVSDARLAAGSCSPVAARLPEAEQALLWRPMREGLSEAVKAEHLARLTPIDDVRAAASYRQEAALQILRDAIEACAAEKMHG
jgi:CO/xanthine dehydrogenase FAD-binding subunit